MLHQQQKEELANTLPSIIDDYQTQITHFKKILFSSQTPKKRLEMLKETWKKSPALRILFSGGSVEVNAFYSLRIKMMDIAEWNRSLKRMMVLELSDIAETMLFTNLEYATWFYGRTTNVGSSDAPDIRQLLSNELLDHFEYALKSGSTRIIDWLWHNNDNLHKAIMHLSSKEQQFYIGIASVAGYQLSLSAEKLQHVSLARINKKRKAESEAESQDSKRLKLEGSSSADRLKRYYNTRSAAKIKLFDELSPPPSLSIPSPEEVNVKEAEEEKKIDLKLSQSSQR